MHYENKVKHLKSNYPRKWWDYVNQMTGKKKSTPSSINFVKDGAILSGKDLAQSLNTYFLSVNNDLPSLDLSFVTCLSSCPPTCTSDNLGRSVY
jgi:hypothetical protein